MGCGQGKGCIAPRSFVVVCTYVSTSAIFVPPWTGDLATEITCWQGYARRIVQSGAYASVIVSCLHDRRVLYEDFATEFVDHNTTIRTIKNGRLIARIEDDAEGRASAGFCERRGAHLIAKHQSATVLKAPGWLPGYDLVLYASPDSGWSSEDWAHFVARIPESWSIAWVGGEKCYRYGGDDFRGASYGTMLTVVALSRAVVGPAAYPVFSAALARTSFVSWTDPVGVDLFAGPPWNPHSVHAEVFPQVPDVPTALESIKRVYRGKRPASITS